MKLNSFEQTALREIGHYFLEKSNNNYLDCHKELSIMGIKNIKYKASHKNKSGNHVFASVYIVLSRPGILIGVRGKVINELEAKLSVIFKEPIKIHVVENRLDEFLYPQDWSGDIL